jgi:hypothetical protein
LLAVGGWLGLLFAGPALMAAGAGGHLGGSLETLVMGLAAAFTVFLQAQRDDLAMERLLPAVCAVAGLGLMLPFAWPVSPAGFGWLAAMAVAACAYAFAGIRLHGLLREIPIACAAAAGAAVAAALAGLGWIALEPGRVALDWQVLGFEAGWGLLVDLPLVLLTVWLLREMEPVGFSSRWVLVPAVTLLGLIAAERPEVGWAGWLGLGLTVGGGMALLSQRVRDDPDAGWGLME